MIELGRQFGLYVIKETVSETDRAVFCKAEDPFFYREVMLKVYSTELFSGEGMLTRVEELLEKLAVLDHPSIAPIYDSGLEGEYYYYTSACYYGGSLAAQLTAALPADRVLKLAAELALALDYALELHLGTELCAEKIYFDAEGRAVVIDFGIESGIEQILACGETGENKATNAGSQGSVAGTLRSLGELLLQLTLGAQADLNERIDDLLATIDNRQLKKLLGRLLLPGEWRFGSYAELLEELSAVEGLAPLMQGQSGQLQSFSAYTAPGEHAEQAEAEQTEQAVVEIRRLVAEKNNLQQSLDKAVYERNVAENKRAEKDRELVSVQAATAKAQEEANVAWELVAGQKYDRWRPVAWTVGGFIVGFLLSGSYGYYYSEQTRNELLAKLEANEELIKSASWRPAGQPPGPSQGAPAVASGAPQAELDKAQAAALVAAPVKEVAQQWWPAGNEFSPTAAIPMEQIRAALGLNSVAANDGLPKVLRQEVLAVVDRWAESWSKQDLGQYFSLYSENYRPELGRTRNEWQDLRRQRLTTPQFIELNIDDISVRQIDENRVQVKLKQSYRSNFYQDQILKSINLIKENGTWRILMERSLGMADDIVGG